MPSVKPLESLPRSSPDSTSPVTGPTYRVPHSLVATLSVDPVKSHTEWLTDVVAHCENKIEIKFPIIGDQDRSISTAYGMIDPGTSDDQSLPLTIRAVFIINPENKLMLSLNYPACVGRNMDEARKADSNPLS